MNTGDFYYEMSDKIEWNEDVKIRVNEQRYKGACEVFSVN